MVRIADEIAALGQLASLLEVSGWPKPGNVHRTADLPGMRFEHFLAGAAALGPSLCEAARRGISISDGELEPSEVGLGELIERATLDVAKLHKGEHTHFGTILLLVPLAAAAGAVIAEHEKVVLSRLRKTVSLLVRETTVNDTIAFFRAAKAALKPEELGRVREPALDVLSPDFEEIRQRQVKLYECMRVASAWDIVCREWVSAMQVTFDIGRPTFEQELKRTNDVNTATVHTFLTILANVPDTWIARKLGLEETEFVDEAVKIGTLKCSWICERARKILEAGGLLTEEGRQMLWKLDGELRKFGSKLNPGSTADLTASSIFVALLRGVRF